MKARKRASEADVIVVNHHLFFADVVLRDEGMADLLPSADTVIFDEAHHLPDIARLFFGQSLSTAQLLELARDTTASPEAQHAKESTQLGDVATARSRRRRATCAFPSAAACWGASRLHRSSRRTRSTRRCVKSACSPTPRFAAASRGARRSARRSLPAPAASAPTRMPSRAWPQWQEIGRDRPKEDAYGEATGRPGHRPLDRSHTRSSAVFFYATPPDVGPIFHGPNGKDGERAWIFTAGHGHAFGEWRFRPLPAVRWDSPKPRARSWAQSLRFRQPGASLRAGRIADPNSEGYVRGRDQRGVACGAGKRAAMLSLLFTSSGGRWTAGTTCSKRASAVRRLGMAAPAAGKWLEERAAGTLPGRSPQRDPRWARNHSGKAWT